MCCCRGSILCHVWITLKRKHLDSSFLPALNLLPRADYTAQLSTAASHFIHLTMDTRRLYGIVMQGEGRLCDGTRMEYWLSGLCYGNEGCTDQLFLPSYHFERLEAQEEWNGTPNHSGTELSWRVVVGHLFVVGRDDTETVDAAEGTEHRQTATLLRAALAWE